MDDLIERLRSVKWEVTDEGDRMSDDPTHKCVFVDMRPDDFRALLDEAADALEAVREDGWQPIETAPKDGTRIQFRNEESGLTDIGHWESWEGMDSDSRSLLPEWAKDWDGEWCTDLGNGDMTHWMPLPAPPKEARNG